MSACFSKSRPNLQERGAQPELRALGDDGAESAADDRAADRAQELAHFVFGRLAGLRGAVPKNDVTELVRHHAGDFTLGGRRFDHAAVDEHRSARERKGVDFAHVDRLERVLEFRMAEIRGNDVDETPADVLHVRRHRVVVHDRQLIARLARRLATELDVLRGVVFVGGGVIRVCAEASDPASAIESVVDPESTFHVPYLVQKRQLMLPTIVNPALLLTQTVTRLPSVLGLKSSVFSMLYATNLKSA